MSTRTVWKYELVPDQEIIVYGGDPKVIHVGADPASMHSNIPSAWVELDPDPAVKEQLRLTFIGTGFVVPDNAEHVGSCITSHGFVWHVYRCV